MIDPYLFFDGCCEEALAFYRDALNAEVSMLMRFRESPEADAFPPEQADKIMHAHFHVAGGSIMASDSAEDGTKGFAGFALSLPTADPAAARRTFDALAAGGTIQMPLQATFWSPAFGIVRDRFGVPWMVSAPAAES
ncbi:VOC family protein [Algiphilus sp. NNCM1]|uniref:VOC family protein n=1 Tax=Algiphilus sp. TaxID=1872431 RepID=UPI001CA6F3AF|nr:VOC family protein [Algiphilus sp.]MBY8965451.1 VOC family protein [Algiphilus acroporae]MCI5102373.1 VOC family protein [Algiphilus sp.]